MAARLNLFARLHKWAFRQDENFLTESLAIELEHLLALAPAVAMRLLHRFTGGFLEPNPDDAGAIEVHTQVEAGEGRPDLVISAPHKLVWVEVKAESELRTGQLEGYRTLLRERGVAQTRLILLTRYPESLQMEESCPDLQVRWFELADWLESELPEIQRAGEVASFLAQQFLEFLGERNMTLTQVGHQMPEGLRALWNLLNMLSEAAAACKLIVKRSPEWGSIGLSLDKHKYWVGVLYDDPGKLWFGTRCRIDPEAAARLGVGELTQENWVPGRNRWWRGVDLDCEEVHFFSRSKVSQMQWLEDFLRECLTMARAIETAEQPPIPEGPEGN